MLDTPTLPAERGNKAVLAAVCLAALVLPINFSGGAVATPAIGRDLGGSAAALGWITNGFMLSFGSLLMAAGALADQIGRKRVFLSGVGGFCLISLALALAPTLPVFDLLRGLQGVAGAAALAGGGAALAQEFDGHARTRAFSLLGTSFGVGLAFGPLLAGLLIDGLGWRAVFAACSLISLGAFLFGARRMHETRDPGATGLDWPGTLTFTATLSLFTCGVIEGPALGWSSPLVWSLLGGSVAMLGLFIRVELAAKRPMLDLSLFRHPRFLGVQALPVATCHCYVVLLILLPLRFIGIEGRSEIEAGFLLMALSAPMLLVPFLAGVLAKRHSPGLLSGLGLLIAAGGLYWLADINPGDGGWAAVAPMLVIGFGSALPWGLMDGLAVSVAPKERAGMATGIFSTTRVAGEGVSLAVVNALLALFVHTHLQGLTTSPGAPLTEAAQRLASGSLPEAAHLLPTIGRGLLLDSYGSAFSTLSGLLIAITLAGALISIFLLRERPLPDDRPDGQRRSIL